MSEVKLCNGSTRRNADTLASLIHFTVSQNDSLLMMDRSIAINTTDKFRNQYVEVTIAVPVGHYIKVNRNFENWNTVRINGFWRNNYDWYNYNDNNGDYDYERGSGLCNERRWALYVGWPAVQIGITAIGIVPGTTMRTRAKKWRLSL